MKECIKTKAVRIAIGVLWMYEGERDIWCVKLSRNISHPQWLKLCKSHKFEKYIQQQFRWTFKHDTVRRDTKHNVQFILLKETSLPLCVVCVLFVLVLLCCSYVYICLFMGGCTKISGHLNGQQWACIVRKT